MILVLLSWELLADIDWLLGLDFQNNYFSPNGIIYNLQEGLGCRRVEMSLSSAKLVFGESDSMFSTFPRVEHCLQKESL